MLGATISGRELVIRAATDPGVVQPHAEAFYDQNRGWTVTFREMPWTITGKC